MVCPTVYRLFALAAAFTPFVSGCRSTCSTTLDCEEGYCSEAHTCAIDCITDDDCRHPAECPEGAVICPSAKLLCDSLGRCHGDFTAPVPDPMSLPSSIPHSDGANLAPGEGIAFVINQLGILGPKDGLDVNGSCAAHIDEDCSDNALAALGGYGNQQIDIGLRQGQTLLLIEIAGLDSAYRGDDDDVTLKIYTGIDTDQVASNNFLATAGSSLPCCEFSIAIDSLDASHRAKSIVPAKIARGRIHPLFPTRLELPLQVGAPPNPQVIIERALASARLSSDLSSLSEGLLTGAVPMRTLANTANPYCATLDPTCPFEFHNATLLDLVTRLIAPFPDVDLDVPSDGIDCVIDSDFDGRIDRCCDGAGTLACTANGGAACRGREVPPLIPGDPQSCVLASGMNDGYSVAFGFAAVRARIVGFAE